jgi:two-component system, NtrC family, nitrogen regulation response regulator NtrX
MRRVMAQIERVAASEIRICIYGETGTGKELVARTLHEKSNRATGPFVTLNCAAVPAELIESELFGHEKGSFTGAAQRHTGKFEQAHRGTLFLDEIGDMPPAMQAKLLRVLEEGEVERIGAAKPTTVDVRVVVATHRNLEQLVESGPIPARSLPSRRCLSPSSCHRCVSVRKICPRWSNTLRARSARRTAGSPFPLAMRRSRRSSSTHGRAIFAKLRNVVERLLLLAGTVVDAEAVYLALPAAHSSHQAASNGAPNARVRWPSGFRPSNARRCSKNWSGTTGTYHPNRQGPWTRTQPPLQEVPAVGNRSQEP